MHEHFSEQTLQEAITGILESAVMQVCARRPNGSRKSFAEACGMSYQEITNRFKGITKIKFREMGAMLKVIKDWDEEIYAWAVREIVFGTMEKVHQMSMFILPFLI